MFNNRFMCSKAPKCGMEYQKKISIPLLDRFSLDVELQDIDASSLIDSKEVDDSQIIQDTAPNAANQQKEGFANTNISFNAEIDAQSLSKFCIMDKEISKILKQALQKNTSIRQRIS